MQGWRPDAAPGFGWPLGERTWINPSPNAPGACDGALLSGHRHARGHDAVRRPRHDPAARGLRRARSRARGARRARCGASRRTGSPAAACGPAGSSRRFTSTRASSARACTIHVEEPIYEHAAFRPWRLQALAFKALRRLRPDYPLWRDFPYEYERDRLAIDLINGSALLREWVDDPSATPADLDALAEPDERAWLAERDPFLLYR